jgi:F5/8 type C domain
VVAEDRLKVDLGQIMLVCQITLNRELARAKEFQIQVSYDALAWTTIYSASAAAIGKTTIDVFGNGRFLRIYGTSRATGYGYSLWDVELHAIKGGVPPPP